jgi:hypothetical protein
MTVVTQFQGSLHENSFKEEAKTSVIQVSSVTKFQGRVVHGSRQGIFIMFTTNRRALTEEYLTVHEVAARLSVKPKTIRNKMASGIFKKGIHFYSRKGIGPRFKWSAVKSWIESEEGATNTAASEAVRDSVPMARGYTMGRPGLGGTKIA